MQTPDQKLALATADLLAQTSQGVAKLLKKASGMRSLVAAGEIDWAIAELKHAKAQMLLAYPDDTDVETEHLHDDCGRQV